MKYKTINSILTILIGIFLVSCAGEIDPPSHEEILPSATSPPETVREVQSTTSPESTSLIDNLEDLSQAVIQIESEGVFVNPEFLSYHVAGRGSGFIISPSGLAITNSHVVSGAALIKVSIGENSEKIYNAEILGVSECSDLALIDIAGDNFPYLEWYSDEIVPEMEVWAAGFPVSNPAYNLTEGIIYGIEEDGKSDWASVDQIVQHSALITPGNSGGPLVTDDGLVVGVNYAADFQRGLSFAIGREAVSSILDDLKGGEDVDSLGINGLAISSLDDSISGIWVSSVKPGSTADQAGVLAGDIIRTLDGVTLATDGTMETFCDIVRTQGDDDTLDFEILRFEADEILEGQFNGRPLAVTSDLRKLELPIDEINYAYGYDENSPFFYRSANIIETFKNGNMSVTDDLEALYLEVPGGWTEVNGSIWESTWGDLSFKAAYIAAAPDLEEFYDSLYSSGVAFGASKDWGAIGGYIQLLDGARHWFTDTCIIQRRDDYSDPVYEGAIDYWDCGNGENLIVIGARPKADPGAYLVFVQIQIVSEAGALALDDIMSSFDVDQDKLP